MTLQTGSVQFNTGGGFDPSISFWAKFDLFQQLFKECTLCLCWFPILISVLVLRWLFFLAKSLSFYGLYYWCTVVQKSPFDSNYSSHKLFYQLTLLPNEFVFFSKGELKCRGIFRKQFQVKIWFLDMMTQSFEINIGYIRLFAFALINCDRLFIMN